MSDRLWVKKLHSALRGCVAFVPLVVLSVSQVQAGDINYADDNNPFNVRSTAGSTVLMNTGRGEATNKQLAQNIALQATATTSYVSSWETLSAVNDNSIPAHSNDKSNGAYGNWNNPNSIQWVQYDWNQNYSLTSTEVYWFDDNGGVLVPTTAYLQYWNGNGWITAGDIPLEKDTFNTLSLDGIVTNRVRVSMLNTYESTGMLEWRVYGTTDGDGDSSESVSFPPVTSEYEYEGINTGNALYFDSDHFRIYYGGNGLYGPKGNLGEHSRQELQMTLDFLEGAYDYYVDERGFRSPGLPVNSRFQGPYKLNVYSVTDLDAGGVMGFDAYAGLSYLVVNSNYMGAEEVYVHEFGHSLTLSEYNWVDKGNTGAWWETTAEWVADTYMGSSQHAAVARRYGRSTNQSILDPYAVIGRSYLSIIHADNRYSNWPFLAYLSNNPDGLNGLNSNAVQQLIRQYQGQETPIHTLNRMVSPVTAQTVMAYYNARLAYMDIGRSAVQQRLFDVINYDAFRDQAYRNLYAAGNSVYRVYDERKPMYGGSNIVPLTITGNGTVDIQVSNLGNGRSDSAFTAIVAIRSYDTGAIRYQVCPDGRATITVDDREEATLVVTNTPTALYTYDAFSSQAGDPELVGLNYQVRLNGAMPTDL
ncbi:DUF6055 domain-containing protein [Gynuella sunshinyii]|uniref:F5/8 type C domain-containing protein n=1 Tax=Gynuella sunshinyii YC6258 TaxID=1445510 RepID=A0A0C5VHV7_9GAMM|nr:DUF6055 domain-containing protein [Gynuella sunshinyii]AJQ92948.1 hypothetical Protein YC6258_00898 [Gynuella sunshinyii YC6258]